MSPLSIIVFRRCLGLGWGGSYGQEVVGYVRVVSGCWLGGCGLDLEVLGLVCGGCRIIVTVLVPGPGCLGSPWEVIRCL